MGQTLSDIMQPSTAYIDSDDYTVPPPPPPPPCLSPMVVPTLTSPRTTTSYTSSRGDGQAYTFHVLYRRSGAKERAQQTVVPLTGRPSGSRLRTQIDAINPALPWPRGPTSGAYPGPNSTWTAPRGGTFSLSCCCKFPRKISRR